MNLVGKHVLEHWVNGGYVQKWLRFINREGKKYYFSDCQYSCFDYDNSLYRAFKGRATRFVKTDETEIGIKPSFTRLSNPDGTTHLSVIEDYQSLTSQYSFDDIFNVDVREVYPEDSSYYKRFKRRGEIYYKERALKYPDDFYTLGFELIERGSGLFEFFDPINDYLSNLFDREKIYYLSEYMEERDNNMSFIQKEVIYLHVNHFGGWKKIRTGEENMDNMTIGFWLFDDCLVWFGADGKSTW